MLVHVMHREHTLSFLRMQSLCRASVSALPRGVRQDRLVISFAIFHPCGVFNL
jgi:hypothetical protein